MNKDEELLRGLDVNEEFSVESEMQSLQEGGHGWLI